MPEEKYTPTQIAEMLEVYGNLRANSESFLSTSTPRGELIVRAVNLFKTIPNMKQYPLKLEKEQLEKIY